MDQALVDVFEQARKVVADADRKVAEEEERRKTSQQQELLLRLGARIEDAFDFTSKEKLELQPRLDVLDGVGVVEFVVRSQRAIFLLLPREGNTWTLEIVGDGHKPEVLREFQGGAKTDQASRRLAAARIVTAIGNWVQNVKGAHAVSNSQTVTERPRPRRAEARTHLRNHGQISRRQ